MKNILFTLLGILATLAIHIVAVLLITVGRRELWVFKNRKNRHAVSSRLLWKITHGY